MRNSKTLFLGIVLTALGACQQPVSPQAATTPAPAQSATQAPAESGTTFERKVACFEASRDFTWNAVSPRDGIYAMTRGCYLPALDTCVVEYVAPDGSAAIFDTLTREQLAAYLNYPGLADQVAVSERLSALPGEGAPGNEAGEDVTPERREYDRVATLVFGSCAR